MSQQTKQKFNSLEEYLRLNYPVTLHSELDGGYTVTIKDLPGCISQGETLEEAMQNIRDAKEAWLKTAFEYDDEIPLPFAK